MDFSGNIVLIGMPGSGKSTLGVLLAKELGLAFLDTDLILQTRTGKRLAELIAEQGSGTFKLLEERLVCEVEVTGTVIATGGSVVYSEAAMRHLRRNGRVVWLDVSLPLLRQRLSDLTGRGVVMAPSQRLEDLYAERRPLYARYADMRIPCDQLAHAQAVAAILERLAS